LAFDEALDELVIQLESLIRVPKTRSLFHRPAQRNAFRRRDVRQQSRLFASRGRKWPCYLAVFSGKLPSMNAPLSPPPPPTDPLCRTCGQGAFNRRKKFRIGPPVVVIGFILLIPSVLGMLEGILTLVGVGMNIPSMNPETRTRLEAQQVPSQSSRRSLPTNR